MEPGNRRSVSILLYANAGRYGPLTRRTSQTGKCTRPSATRSLYLSLIHICLTHAELVELLIPGDDEEETETFRQRVLDSFQSQAFGGNQADYREQVLAMPGVGLSLIHIWPFP